MTSTVKAADVQNRLYVLSTIEINATLIDSNPYLPFCDAYMVKLAEKNNATYEGLDAEDKILANQIVVNLCCIKLVSSAPLPSLDAGSMKVKDATPEAKKQFIKQCEKEIDEIMGILNWSTWKGISSYSSSEDFFPDEEDRRNVLFLDDEETAISLWD